VGLAEKLVKNYKAGLFLSLVVLLASLGTIGFNLAATGKVVPLGIDFTGGTQATVQLAQGSHVSSSDITAVENAAARLIGGELRVRAAETQVFVESGQQLTKEVISDVMREAGVSFGSIDIYIVGPALGSAFLGQAVQAIAAAFAAMAIVALVSFRSLVPSLAMILAGSSNLAFALAGMSILGLPLNLATLAGLLMVIGYSIDTNILLSTRVLRRRMESVAERVVSSLNTGLTMTFAAMASVAVLYLVASLAPTLQQIAAIILLGLTADLIFTWLQNASILRLYLERKQRRAERRASGKEHEEQEHAQEKAK